MALRCPPSRASQTHGPSRPRRDFSACATGRPAVRLLTRDGEKVQREGVYDGPRPSPQTPEYPPMLPGAPLGGDLIRILSHTRSKWRNSSRLPARKRANLHHSQREAPKAHPGQVTAGAKKRTFRPWIVVTSSRATPSVLFVPRLVKHGMECGGERVRCVPAVRF